MKTAIIAAALALVTAAANAQDVKPGYDRPSTDRQHQHVIYFNDSFDHYDIDMQTAADAYSTNDLYDKHDNRAKKPTGHEKHTAK